jgi:hypothetical protein
LKDSNTYEDIGKGTLSEKHTSKRTPLTFDNENIGSPVVPPYNRIDCKSLGDKSPKKCWMKLVKIRSLLLKKKN